MAGINLGGANFTRGAAVPLDDSFVAANTTVRDAIGSGIRYEGMLVYVIADQKMYQLQGGILNANWTLAGGGAAPVVTVNTFTGNGGATYGFLSVDPVIKNNTLVYLNGQYVQKADYSLSGTGASVNVVLTFNIDSLDNLEVISGSVSLINAPAVGSVVTASIASGAVTKDKLAALGEFLSSSCGIFSTSSTSPTDVTNLTGSFTTTGRLLELSLVGDGSFSGGIPGSVGVQGGSSDKSAYATVKIYNVTLGTLIDQQSIFIRDNATAGAGSLQSILIPSSSIKCVTKPAAGTYTFKVTIEVQAGTQTANVYNSKLLIKEN